MYKTLEVFCSNGGGFIIKKRKNSKLNLLKQTDLFVASELNIFLKCGTVPIKWTTSFKLNGATHWINFSSVSRDEITVMNGRLSVSLLALFRSRPQLWINVFHIRVERDLKVAFNGFLPVHSYIGILKGRRCADAKSVAWADFFVCVTSMLFMEVELIMASYGKLGEWDHVMNYAVLVEYRLYICMYASKKWMKIALLHTCGVSTSKRK